MMIGKWKKAARISFLVIIISGCHSNTPYNTKNRAAIIDMTGRKIIVPKKIEKVFCSDMTTTMLLYSLSPELLIGINNKLGEKNKKYVTEQFYNLPVLGRIFVGKSGLNEEQLINMKPDILLCPVFRFTGQTDIDAFVKAAKRIGVPAVLIDMEMEKLADTYQFLGELLHKKKKALEFSGYCKRTMQLAAKTKALLNGSVSIYIAEGENGLHTIPAGSAHSQIFDMVGLRNCANIDERYGYTDMQINIEQLISWNPQLIFLGSRESSVNKNIILQNKSWKVLNAVKNEQVITIPDRPFNWIGRPPGINRLIGVYWLVQHVSPDLLEQSIIDESIDFYSMFYHVSMNPDDIKMLIN